MIVELTVIMARRLICNLGRGKSDSIGLKDMGLSFFLIFRRRGPKSLLHHVRLRLGDVPESENVAAKSSVPDPSRMSEGEIASFGRVCLGFMNKRRNHDFFRDRGFLLFIGWFTWLV